MPISYQEQAELSCPACAADFAASIWLILDAQEQPAAVDALRQGGLNMATCPSCGNTGPAGAPLLFHDAAARRVVFAGAPGAAEHEVRDQARELHALLVGSIPEEQRRPYLADVDIVQDLAGLAHLLERAARRRAAAPQPAVAAPAVAAPADAAPPLLVAVQELLSADTPVELDRVLAAHPLLLDPATDSTLAQLADVAVEQRAYEIADSLQRARRLLLDMGSSLDGTNAAVPSAELVLSALPELALQALLQAQNAGELLSAVDVHNLLLHPEVDALLAERVDLALDDGNERLAQALEDRREALAELRAVRAASASEGDPGEPTLEEAIEALLIADGQDELADVIDRYPMLLEDVVAQALWQFAAEARASGDDEMAIHAVECRELLQRVRDGLEN